MNEERRMKNDFHHSRFGFRAPTCRPAMFLGKAWTTFNTRAAKSSRLFERSSPFIWHSPIGDHSQFFILHSSLMNVATPPAESFFPCSGPYGRAHSIFLPRGV